MSESSEQMKATAVTLASQPSGQGDAQLDLVMQSLMIDATDVKRILKGEIHEPLNKLNQLYVALHQQLAELLDNPAVTSEQTSVLLKIKSILELIQKQEAEIYIQLEAYKEYVPYLLLFASNTVLSNIDVKQADSVMRKISIMIMRSKLKSKRKGRTMETRNFFDSIEILLFLQLQRSINGLTFKGLVQERKEVTTVIRDETQKKKRRFF